MTGLVCPTLLYLPTSDEASVEGCPTTVLKTGFPPATDAAARLPVTIVPRFTAPKEGGPATFPIRTVVVVPRDASPANPPDPLFICKELVDPPGVPAPALPLKVQLFVAEHQYGPIVDVVLKNMSPVLGEHLVGRFGPHRIWLAVVFTTTCPYALSPSASTSRAAFIAYKNREGLCTSRSRRRFENSRRCSWLERKADLGWLKRVTG